tara:strand:- start:106973 stop:107281 length:309 start_codon:yes stop_codon:yes gene_type:complete
VKIVFFSLGETVPAQEWLMKQDSRVRLFILKYIERVSIGGTKRNVKALGGGLFEIKVDKGPGYRVYFGEDKNVILVILCCGTKRSQKSDIEKARKYWRLYNA